MIDVIRELKSPCQTFKDTMRFRINIVTKSFEHIQDFGCQFQVWKFPNEDGVEVLIH